MKSVSKFSEWFIRHKACGNFAVLLVSVFSLFLCMSLQTNTFSIMFHVLSALADASVITLPFLFLQGRWQYIGAGVSLFWGIVVLANVLYFRNFADLIPGPLYFRNQIGDSLVLNSAFQSLRCSDILIAVFSLFPLILLLWHGCSSTTRSDRMLMLIVTVIIFVMSWAGTLTGEIRRYRIWYPDSKESVMEIIYPDDALSWISYYRGSNFTGYAVRVLSKSLNNYHELTAEDLEEIRSCIRSHSYGGEIIPCINQPDNLIFIVVESLPARALSMADAEYVAPVLSSLMNDSSSVTVKRCRILIELGQSSDAQFIYNTGLLPLRNNIFVTYYAANDYPGLAKALKKESLEIIGEKKTLWSHALTNKSYGYDRILDNIVDWNALNQDGIILDSAVEEIKKVRKPFYAFVTTLSMHDPYDVVKVKPKLSPDSLSDSNPRYLEYMERLHHFDESLGRFLRRLKSSGLYNNSCIVISGDHHIRPEAGIPSLNDDAVPLIILNSSIKGEHATEATQLDVFPTILDIMGVGDYEYMGVKYRGLGKTIFRQKPGSGPEMPTDRDYEVSEMIIRHK